MENESETLMIAKRYGLDELMRMAIFYHKHMMAIQEIEKVVTAEKSNMSPHEVKTLTDAINYLTIPAHTEQTKRKK